MQMMTAQQDVFESRKLRKNSQILERPRNSQVGNTVWGFASDISARYHHSTRARAIHA